MSRALKSNRPSKSKCVVAVLGGVGFRGCAFKVEINRRTKSIPLKFKGIKYRVVKFKTSRNFRECNVEFGTIHFQY
jgi:hypothetical protein